MRNWNSVKMRSLMAKRGVEDWRDGPGIMAPLIGPRVLKPRTSKAELRKQAGQAFAEWCERQGDGPVRIALPST